MSAVKDPNIFRMELKQDFVMEVEDAKGFSELNYGRITGRLFKGPNLEEACHYEVSFVDNKIERILIPTEKIFFKDKKPRFQVKKSDLKKYKVTTNNTFN